MLRQEKIKTSNIDRLAKEGVRFTQHYTGAPVCAPARCMFMTGKNPAHAEIRGNRGSGNGRKFCGQWTITDEVLTIAEVVQRMEKARLNIRTVSKVFTVPMVD